MLTIALSAACIQVTKSVDGVLVDFSPSSPLVIEHACAPFPASLRAELLALNRTGPDELHLLEAVDDRRPLSDLVNTPPLTPGENARILYAFFALGLVVVRRPTGQIKVQVKVGTPTE